VKAAINELVIAHDLLALHVEYAEGRYFLAIDETAPGTAEIRRAIELLDPDSLHRVEGYNNANKIRESFTGIDLRSL